MPFGLGTLGKGIMNAPGMGAIRKPLAAGMQKTPGLKGVGNKIGLGPSQLQQKMQPPQQGPALGQANWGPAVQNAGAAIGNAFGMNRPRPEPMQMQAPPLQAPEQQMQEPDPQAIQAMQNMKMQQMAQMGRGIGSGMGQMFGGMGGGQGMMRPQPFQRGEQMNQLASPDESFDQQRKNKFQQMRAGGIGPRFGMRQPQIQPEPEPQQY
jgi:hypothetical protein